MAFQYLKGAPKKDGEGFLQKHGEDKGEKFQTESKFRLDTRKKFFLM